MKMNRCVQTLIQQVHDVCAQCEVYRACTLCSATSVVECRLFSTDFRSLGVSPCSTSCSEGRRKDDCMY